MKATVLALLLIFLIPHAVAAQRVDLEEVVELRLSGDLDAARQLIHRHLESPALADSSRVQLHLELARIFDRLGLHRNTRPVAAALEHVDLASLFADSTDVEERAQIQLAYARQTYRVEMTNRRFPEARAHALEALRLFSRVEDCYGQADAVHLIGLLELQSGNNDRAAELFDESMDLDVNCGGRVFFEGEYGRHRAFVFLRKNQPEQALPLLIQSLQARQEAGAVDASMFAAMTLASAHLDLGDPNKALVAGTYALVVAQQIDSARGKAQSALVLGHVFSELGHPDEANEAYRTSRKFAASIGLTSIQSQAEAGIERLSNRGGE